MSIKRLIVILFAICFTLQAKAQEQLGLRVENYAGINSALLNPANTLSYPLSWDLNLVSASVFAENNFAHFVNANLRDIINAESFHTPFDEGNPRPEDVLVDFNPKENKKFVSVFTQVTGPSFSVKIGEENTIGLFTNLRAAFSTQSIPAELGYYQLYTNPPNNPLDVNPGMMAGMVWSEIGLSYARKVYTSDGYIGLGINVKFLNAYEGGFAENTTTFSAVQLVADTFVLSDPNIVAGYTDSNIDVIDGAAYSRDKNGSGVAFDLGFTYVYEGSEDNYKLKLGASILDFGRIKFNRNAGQYRVNFDGPMQFVTGDYSSLTNPNELAEQLSSDIYNDPTSIRTGNEFGVWLPSAISLQADYLVIPMFYVNGVLVQRMPTLGVMVERGNMLAVTPRFEHRWFSASLPFVLYNYKNFNVGASVRLGYLTLGTDNLGSLIGNSNFTGTDFYVGLKFNPFDMGLNLGGGGFGRGGKKVKCYDF